MKTERMAARSTLAGLLAHAVLVVGAAAQALPSTPPLPPPRPAMPGDTQREQLEPPAAEAPEAAPKRADQPVAPPPASDANGISALDVDRDTRRACAIEWERLKESGAAGALVWREFLADCAKRRSKP